MATLVYDSGVRGSRPSLVGGLGTGVFVFPAPGGPSFNDGGNILGNQFPVAVKPAQVVATAPSSEGIQFTIKGSGNIYIGAGTVLFKLMAGTSLTSTSNTLVASCSAQTLTAGAYYPYAFSITMQGDANSGYVQVVAASLYINGSTVTFTISESSPPSVAGIALSGQNLLTTAIPFCLAAQFGTSNAGNLAALQSFYLEN